MFDSDKDARRACCATCCRFGLRHPGHYQVLFSATLGLDPKRPGDRPGERVFGRLVAAIQACVDTGTARRGDAQLMTVTVWVALHGMVSLRTSRPGHPWPPVDTLIDPVLSGQVWP
ncbi:MAG TPA: TetR-like C-terminal domain-containing protein [Pseudonocardiaceae bacterium]|nr:TetR-like C-terminal domain-containing protein [Pseudonocardiaceae bacterium]